MRAPRLGPGSSVILSSDPSGGRILNRWLDRAGHSVGVVRTLDECSELLDRSTTDLLVVDLGVPDDTAFEWLGRVNLRYPRLAMLVLTDSTSVQDAVRAMQSGAYDYLLKPTDEVRLITASRNALAFHRLSTRVAHLEREVRGEGFSGMVGRSPVMKRLYHQLDRIAASDVTVMIRGESGVGKELVARAIHENSSRSDRPFVAVNCAAIPENLQESELFGHEKGAFTGATDRRIGRFEQADGGTLFFDEVGELSPALQAKLLRVLQERRFSRVGGASEIEVDVRILGATHRDLAGDVRSGRFRQDLYYRLAVIEFVVPRLREREGDIPLLAQTFLDAYDAGRGEAEPRSLDIPVLQTFLAYPWPGNVRELQNAVHRAAVLAEATVLTLADLPPALIEFARTHDLGSQPLATPGHNPRPVGGVREDSTPPHQATSAGSLGLPLPDSVESPMGTAAVPRPFIPAGMNLEQIEEFAVREALGRARGNVSATARALGISRSVLYRKLDRFGLKDGPG